MNVGRGFGRWALGHVVRNDEGVCERLRLRGESDAGVSMSAQLRKEERGTSLAKSVELVTSQSAKRGKGEIHHILSQSKKYLSGTEELDVGCKKRSNTFGFVNTQTYSSSKRYT